MTRTFQISVLGIACLLVQQALPVASAQENQPGKALERTSPPQMARTRGAWGMGVAATTKPERADGAEALTGERRPLYRLTRSDVVEVNFTFSPELNQTLSVLPDGLLALKGARSVCAEGRTLAELADDIRLAYGGILHEPEISVTLKEFERPYFIAAGEVARPGKYELRGDTTLLEAVAIAGGFTGRARHSQVVLFRRRSAELAEARVVNAKKMLHSKNLGEDAHLRPGDLVFVPQSAVSSVRRYLPVPNLGMYLNPSQF